MGRLAANFGLWDVVQDGRRLGRQPERLRVTTRNLATDYRRKAEEARAIAETMGNNSARATVLEVAATWDRLADVKLTQCALCGSMDRSRCADGQIAAKPKIMTLRMVDQIPPSIG